jgi:DNA-binding response OmpR family regulator
MACDPKISLQPLIVFVEDEKNLADFVCEELHRNQMSTRVFNQASGVVEFLSTHTVALVLLDINLPDQNGLELMEEFSERKISSPVIFLTANDSENQKISAFNLGGYDYIVKPFSLPEFVARVKSTLSRSERNIKDISFSKQSILSTKSFSFSNAQVNPVQFEIIFPNGNAEQIGRKELAILNCLFLNQGKIVPRDEIIRTVWQEDVHSSNRSLDQYILKIRNLFKKHGYTCDCIRNIYGMGYIYNPQF